MNIIIAFTYYAEHQDRITPLPSRQKESGIGERNGNIPNNKTILSNSTLSFMDPCSN